MKRILSLLFVAVLLSTASAQFYFGLPSSTMVAGGGTATLIGFQAGSHNVIPNLGVRGYLESDPLLAGIWFQGGADVLFTTGGNSKFYVGGGAGFASIDTGTVGGTLPYLSPVIGGDFDAGTAVSLFIEADPRIYVGNGALMVFTIRSGINFHIGGGEDTNVRVVEAPEPVVMPVADMDVNEADTEASTDLRDYPPGTYIDAEGNAWVPMGTED